VRPCDARTDILWIDTVSIWFMNGGQISANARA
jgi:hypothetical protein